VTAIIVFKAHYCNSEKVELHATGLVALLDTSAIANLNSHQDNHSDRLAVTKLSERKLNYAHSNCNRDKTPPAKLCEPNGP
jgi:hypothetical protein